jgi:hypothetical protein
MPYKNLPPHIRLRPEVQDAWHLLHEERLDKIESRQSSSEDARHGKTFHTPIGDYPQWLLPIIVALAALVVIVRPEIILAIIERVGDR